MGFGDTMPKPDHIFDLERHAAGVRFASIDLKAAYCGVRDSPL